ncbi:MAG: helix-turn-helix transcriptional regulator [Sphingomonas sp.]|uniref:helix-turn-helix transcriptional regulator n=1 Tax=Sphingomonas sp. TaxID=28214 RepID=UPI0035A8C632|nr:helix-turn-helix transcriptional regulator [Sphingomonas sp.]
MSTKTPFEELSQAIAVRSQAGEHLESSTQRSLRQQKEELFGPTTISLAIGEAFKAAYSNVTGGLRGGPIVSESLVGLNLRDALSRATLTPRTKSMNQSIASAIAAAINDGTRYRSPARELLDLIGTPPQVKQGPSGRSIPALPSPSTVNDPKAPITITSTIDIGKRVKEARRAMGMTQQRFADMAGVGRRFLIELEHGKASLEIGRVLAVCQAAGIKLGITT